MLKIKKHILRIKNPRLFILPLLTVFLCFYGIKEAIASELRIRRVSIEGNTFIPDNRIHAVMYSKPPTFFTSVVYNEREFDRDLERIENFYHGEGYLQAVIVDHEVIIDSAENNVYLRIRIKEGLPTLLDRIEFHGNDSVHEEDLIEALPLLRGELFRRIEIENSTVAILSTYANRGFLDARVDPEVKVNEQLLSAVIEFHITENTQYRINQIRINGLSKTKENVLTRELHFQRGDIVNYSKLLSSQRELYLTGLFQSVFIRPVAPQNGPENMRDILVEVRERDSGEVGVSLGFDTIDKARSTMRIFNNNLRGTGLQTGLLGRISSRGEGVDGSFTQPWTFNTPWRTDFVLSWQRIEEPGYDIQTTGGLLTAGRRFRANSAFTITYRHETSNYDNIRVSEVTDERVNTSSFILSIIDDRRNNIFNPTDGLLVRVGTELGSFRAAGYSSFSRLTSDFRYYRSLDTETVIATGIEFGVIDSREVPLNERFYAGGPFSLRGFEYQHAGPLDEQGNPVGGRLKLAMNVVELRRMLFWRIGGVVFLDAGNVWERVSDFNFDLRSSAGIGFRLDTPVGLARLDLGTPLFRRTGEPALNIYFSMGQAF